MITKKQKGFSTILVVAIALMVIAGGVLAWQYWPEQVEQEAIVEQEIEQEPSVIDETADWQIYRNEEYGFEMGYPNKLTVIEDQKPNIVVFNHFIPYENRGDCDMLGGIEIFTTLDDFNVSLEIVSPAVIPGYSDGDSQIGDIQGIRVYNGVEWCGNMVYYFPLGEDRTLIIRRAMIQALSGNASYWDEEEILSIKGVISAEEAEEIFNHMLSTFKFIN